MKAYQTLPLALIAILAAAAAAALIWPAEAVLRGFAGGLIPWFWLQLLG